MWAPQVNSKGMFEESYWNQKLNQKIQSFSNVEQQAVQIQKNTLSGD